MKTFLTLLMVFLLSTPAFAAFKATEGDVWDPSRGSIADFGKMTIGTNTIAWDKVSSARYKVIMSKESQWIIEFDEGAYPMFDDISCKFIKFNIKFSRLFPYQLLLECYIYDPKQNPFKNDFIFDGAYTIYQD